MNRRVTRIALLSVVAGAALFYFAVVQLGGVLAGVAVPRKYFEFMGREHLDAGLALVFAATWALPIAAAIAAGVGAILLCSGRAWRPAAACTLAGMAVVFAYYQAELAVSLQQSAEVQLTLGTALLRTFVVSWYFVPNVVAPWLGFAFGLAAVLRYRRQHARARVA